jgi:hypothetical protein
MKFLILSFLLFGCKFEKNEKTVITFQWEGNRDKPIAVIVFTNNNAYENKDIKYYKLFKVSDELMYELIEKVPRTDTNSNGNFPLKVTLQQSGNINYHYFNKNTVVQLFDDFQNILNKSNSNSPKNELISVGKVIF